MNTCWVLQELTDGSMHRTTLPDVTQSPISENASLTYTKSTQKITLFPFLCSLVTRSDNVTDYIFQLNYVWKL